MVLVCRRVRIWWSPLMVGWGMVGEGGAGKVFWILPRGQPSVLGRSCDDRSLFARHRSAAQKRLGFGLSFLGCVPGGCPALAKPCRGRPFPRGWLHDKSFREPAKSPPRLCSRPPIGEKRNVLHFAVKRGKYVRNRTELFLFPVPILLFFRSFAPIASGCTGTLEPGVPGPAGGGGLLFSEKRISPLGGR